MRKNKLFLIVIAMLVVITLILVATFIIWNFMDGYGSNPDPASEARSTVSNVSGVHMTPAQVSELTVPIPEVITNLADPNSVIRVGFAFSLDSKSGKEEFETLNFRVRNIILQTLADLRADEISGKQGQQYLLSLLMNEINELLTSGNVYDISITDYYIN